MSVGFRAVSWTPHKRRYDAVLTVGVVLFIGVYALLTKLLYTGVEAISDEVLLIRSLGACAITLLHLALAIGPLHRLWPEAAPLLFNRRHLGVLTFLVAAAHALISVGYYHGFGIMNPLRSLLVNSTNYASLQAFPFEMLGLMALMVLFALAATSHDVWLKVLSPLRWKRLHMLLYPAYVLLIGHVALGGLQVRSGWAAPSLLILGAVGLAGLHSAAAWTDARRRRIQVPEYPSDHPWLAVGDIESIPFDRARTVCTPAGDRIAVFRSDAGITAIDNRCAHQGGPLGEGRVIDGCITCPWHGWQYRAADGCAPPPFTEKLRTYQVRILDRVVQVNTVACEPGHAPPPAVPGPAASATTPTQITPTQITPAQSTLGGTAHRTKASKREPEFYVNYLPTGPRLRLMAILSTGAAMCVLAAVAATAALSQRTPGPAVWDDGHLRQFTGLLVATPAPALLTTDPTTGGQHTMLIVEVGKHGAAERLAPLIGARVTASGWLLQRDGRTMIELEPDALPIVVDPAQPLASTPDDAVARATTKLGTVTLRGEIVDAKCFWGAMKPGDGKTHKACATLCIRGGIPPVLVVRSQGAQPQYYLVRGTGATPMPRLLESLIADPIEITGTHLRLGDLNILEVTEQSAQRL
jgi:nitrite reductase/ring-hydroxylating ferredoxin subunit/DMSO/TMAO reductase YedYZ heme-binding membrane subunit